jgi:hypothetical protein
MKIENYKKLCAKAKKEGKVVISISLLPEQAEWIRQKRNTSAYIQRLIQKEMNKETRTTAQSSESLLMKKFSDIMVKYGFWQLPNLEDMKKYTAWLGEKPEEKRKDALAPEYYIFHIIMYKGEDGTLRLTPEHKQLLKEARKIPLERRTQMLWQAIRDALKRTEIKEGLPLILFVANELIDFNKDFLALDRVKVEKTTITQLAEKSGIPFQQFYTKVVPKLRQILEWNGVDVGI